MRLADRRLTRIKLRTPRKRDARRTSWPLARQRHFKFVESDHKIAERRRKFVELVGRGGYVVICHPYLF
jgi:hypothetical protein